MALSIPNGHHIAPEWKDLATKLVNGDGLGFSGDPRLDLRIGIMEKKLYGRTIATGRRLEVWRRNEDGSEGMVGHWLPTEQHRVCYDLARMRPDSPGFESVETRIDRHNAKVEKASSDRFVAAASEMLEHAARLDHDRNQPRNRFYMAGRGGAAKA